jgi:hypothetical protein
MLDYSAKTFMKQPERANAKRDQGGGLHEFEQRDGSQEPVMRHSQGSLRTQSERERLGR